MRFLTEMNVLKGEGQGSKDVAERQDDGEFISAMRGRSPQSRAWTRGSEWLQCARGRTEHGGFAVYSKIDIDCYQLMVN